MACETCKRLAPDLDPGDAHHRLCPYAAIPASYGAPLRSGAVHPSEAYLKTFDGTFESRGTVAGIKAAPLPGSDGGV